MIQPQLKPLFDALKKSMQEIIIPVVCDEAKKTWGDIKKDTQGLYKEFCDALNANPKMKSYVVIEEVELLKAQNLVEIVKSNIVKDSSEAYVWKIQEKDATYVHVAYGKDRELMDKDNNKFVLIKALALSTDVLNLFEESELVILK